MRIILLPLLFLSTPLAHAHQVYKCVQGVQVMYQSQPCDPAQRTVKQWDATPEERRPKAAEDSRKSAPAPAPRNKPRSRPATVGRKGRVSLDAAEVRCKTAKSKRESKLKAVGLNRTFDLLRKLDDAVHQACR